MPANSLPQNSLAPAPQPTENKAGKPPDAGPAIRIRMYRVGFGDCFLVSLPTDGGAEHILIDCCVHGRGDIGTMARVVDDIAQVTGKRLALVIATHPHQEHIAGFARCEDIFREFQVRDVWLAWTENPKDLDATRLKQGQAALAASLTQHLAAKP